ncbi:LafX [Aeromonas allosaccharophila]|uniref:LafX n=2 Tax=Aeromonas allosaccharophila TaxID=656 RepID=UPI001EFB7CD7|nr:LafX [Aeromonas allosaccharophila]
MVIGLAHSLLVGWFIFFLGLVMSGIAPVLRETELQTRQRQLLGLGTLLLQQAQAGQWDAVRLTDGRFAQFVSQVSRNPQLWAALQPARDKARMLYRQALQLCEQETLVRKQEWQQLSSIREGLTAYGEAQQWD